MSCKITVVTVCFNAEETIKETIESVISQKNVNIEYVIVDGNSTDKTKKIIEEYVKDNSIKYISENDDGIYDAMNKGIELAEGEYIIFLNSGDVFYDNLVLKDVESKLKKDIEIDVLYGNVELDKNGEKTLYSYSNFKIDAMFFCRELMICHQCIFIRREILKKYKFDTKYIICADKKQIIKLMKNKYKFQYFDRVISIYDCNGFSEKNINLLRKEAKEIIYEEFGLYARIIFLLRFIKNSLNKIKIH